MVQHIEKMASKKKKETWFEAEVRQPMYNIWGKKWHGLNWSDYRTLKVDVFVSSSVGNVNVVVYFVQSACI